MLLASVLRFISVFFFFNDTATTEIYTLSLHDALPIFDGRDTPRARALAEMLSVVAPTSVTTNLFGERWSRSEEHTSELQSPCNLVCRLLLEKKKKQQFSLQGHRPLPFGSTMYESHTGD